MTQILPGMAVPTIRTDILRCLNRFDRIIFMAAKRIKKRGVRTVPISPELADALEQQRKAFVEKFGREPEKGDPIFFDPSEETPQPYSQKQTAETNKAIVEAMERAGIDPAKIYAFKKTGFMPTAEGWENMSPADKAEYKAALLRYKEEGDPEMDDSELRIDLLTLLDSKYGRMKTMDIASLLAGLAFDFSFDAMGQDVEKWRSFWISVVGELQAPRREEQPEEGDDRKPIIQ